MATMNVGASGKTMHEESIGGGNGMGSGGGNNEQEVISKQWR